MTALAVISPPKQNKTEAEYDAMLRRRLHDGEIQRYRFEEITLKLGHDCRYTPDFYVVLANGEIECHEVKGAFIRDGALEKLRTAAYMHPFRFILAQKKDGVWSIKPVPPATSIAPKSDAGPLSAVSGSSRRARPSSVQAAQLQSESEVMPNDGGVRARQFATNPTHVTSPREGARRVKSSKGVTEAALASWRPGDPWPPGFARLAGKWVRLEYAKDLIGR